MHLHRPEDARHAQHHEECYEEKVEERSGCSIQVGHEVYDEVEAYAVADLIGHIYQDGRKRFRRCVVECIANMFLHNWTLGILGENFESAREGIR